MIRWRSLLLFGLSLLAASAARAQVPPEKALSTFTVNDPALEMTLWASEPLFVNPTCMDIDHKGRVWVCESVNYRHQLRRRPPNRPAGDRIVILEDTKGTGKADKATTFYQSPETLAPLGIAVAKDPEGPGYKVFVCQSPDILVFEDKDGDGKADGPPKKLLSGFGGIDHDHGVHGILIGPDGKLYFSVGDQGVHDLRSSDGKGRKWTSNSTDCRAGTIWRCDLDGKNLELIAHNFRNEYEPCVDSFGTVFVSDNDDDGNQQTRICYVMPGGNYGYHPRGPGQSHWHEEQPGVVPKILRTYFGSPTGICVYEGTLLPKKYWGQLLHTDAGPRQVRCYHLTPDGAGYAVERDDMVTSTDNWFRPSDICVAPDGSVYVADWYDPGVGGHGMGDTTRGRIYRIAPKGHKPNAPKVDLESTKGIMAALASPNLAVRYMAINKIQSMEVQQVIGPKVTVPKPVKAKDKQLLEALREAATSRDNPILKARALWQLAILPGFGFQDPLIKALFDPDPRFRILALRALKDRTGGVFVDTPVCGGATILRGRKAGTGGVFMRTPDGCKAAIAKEPSKAVLREMLLLSRDCDPENERPFILELAKQYDGKDRFYLEAIGIAVGHHDSARRAAILADFDKQFPELNDKILDLIWELRPPSVLPQLEKRLADAHLSAAQRGRIVDILAASEDIKAGTVLLEVLQSDIPADVREKILDNLKLFLPGKWRNLRQSPELTATVERLLHQPGTRTAALVLIGAAEKIDAIAQVADLARDAREAKAIRSAAIQTLGFLPDKEAVNRLDTLLAIEPARLREEVVQALGRQAQAKSKDAGAPPARAVKILQNLVLAGGRDLRLRQAAVTALAGTRAGSIWLLQAHDQKELPEGLKPEVARLLRNSPYQDLRNKAMLAFPPAGKLDLKKLPSIAALARRRGDVARGKQLLVASVKNDLQCLKCHTIRAAGGQIGPDLSVIGKKASRENLFESILWPSKAIADQYLTWTIETSKGLALSGLIVEETPTAVTLRDANGKDTRIAKKDIDARAKSPNSLMPADLVVYMTEEELVDMVEYLFTLKTPALALDYWHIIGPFDNGAGDAGLHQVFPPEKDLDLKKTYRGKSGPVGWRTVKPNEKGYVDLRAFLAGDSDNVVSYLYREVESPADQEAIFLLGTDDCAKLWVHGKLVYTNPRHRAAVPEEDAVKVALKRGRNSILLKINNGDGDHGFYLTVQAEQELKPVGDAKK